MRAFFVIFFCFGYLLGHGQKNDYTWIVGGNSVNIFKYGYQWGTAIADFKKEPVEFRYDEKITMDFSGTNSIISNTDGDLLMYSNGMYVQNRYHQDVLGLDTISYSPHWENFNYHDYLPDGSPWKSGLPGDQWILMLPDPANDTSHYIFHPYVENQKGPLYLAHLLMTKVEFGDNRSQGKVIYKDSVVRSGVFQWGLTAVKHGNGRDWWLIHGTHYNQTYDIYLLDPAGIKYVSSASDIYRDSYRYVYGNARFSSRGDFYVVAEGIEQTDSIRVAIYNFDRCSGLLTKNSKKILTDRKIFRGSVDFSLDGKFLYYTNGYKMYQCDMEEEDIFGSEVVVAEYDGSISEIYKGKLIFSAMMLAPDGKIYCIPPGNTRSIHTIEYPDERDSVCTVIQNKIALPVQNFNSLPNLPYYRLGPADGSTCDTLGLDNMPQALFRFEQDTADHLRLRFTDLSYFRPQEWLWDFGDGTSFVGRKPYWHQFKADGQYNVCLKVSNENGEHTYCRNIVIGHPSSTQGLDDVEMDVHLFPNPSDGDFNLTVSSYIPQRARILIYNSVGDLIIHKKIFYGQNKIELADHPSGIYFYQILENGMSISNGKMIKI